jgi:DNA-binding NtrC family response regulator
MAQRILIIDDSKIMRDLLVDFLQDSGYEVFATEHPEEAAAEAERVHYDLCICDKHLSGHDGLTVVRDMERKFFDTKFILTDSLPISSTIDRVQPERFLYLGKPFELDQLRQLIADSLEQVKR